jgi:hypothetical protein
MKIAVCNRAAFQPFQRLVAGPLGIEDLPDAERFVRAVVLHDDVGMLPERFRIDVRQDGSSVVRTVHVLAYGFERLGRYQDPWFDENWEEGKKLLNTQFRETEFGGYVFDPYQRSFTTAVAQIESGGSAVVRDSVWEIEVAYASQQGKPEIKRHPAEWETRLARAENRPERLFDQLDESWQTFGKEVAEYGLELRIPPVLGIVLSRCARRDAIPDILLDLRNEWASARAKVWDRLDSLRNVRTLEEAAQIRLELKAASKLFSGEQTDFDTQPIRVFWEMAFAAAAGAVVASGTPLGPVGGAATGAIGAAARAAPKLLQEIGPALFGRGAFDLAKKVRRETGKVEPGVLRRLLSQSELQAFGIK